MSGLLVDKKVYVSGLEDKCRSDMDGCWSNVFFSWLTPLLESHQQASARMWKTLARSLGGPFVVAELLKLLHDTVQFYFFLRFETGMRFRSAVVTAVCDKSLVLSAYYRAKTFTGEITILMSIDGERLIGALNARSVAPLK
ncbi:hypothetical protein H257_14517 [Aphanomyces astaci]|uniref:Uncharacterized protein n=1 Tax=Aphanomyces astaci TaxID=112090 RepID=W4FQZ4_APHAT|nr:hypothetical protein H257_14517 [Aphanomyces astaci]ETV69920.1 hypothetical protein H257_14517 [Aphanomyces astaci]|eukprot:XP_009840658.1 hypothetical protein H257_14517 [Aphanomyces astaci]